MKRIEGDRRTGGFYCAGGCVKRSGRPNRSFSAAWGIRTGRNFSLALIYFLFKDFIGGGTWVKPMKG